MATPRLRAASTAPSRRLWKYVVGVAIGARYTRAPSASPAGAAGVASSSRLASSSSHSSTEDHCGSICTLLMPWVSVSMRLCGLTVVPTTLSTCSSRRISCADLAFSS
ncbi:hypothetical protein [Sorangium sp. So ce1151]|uniref:hypothetical protein n=1 Tax=Sorangium sp. So ce1151 TaxID=3133332 RepID=UPI003F647291